MSLSYKNKEAYVLKWLIRNKEGENLPQEGNGIERVKNSENEMSKI